MANLIRNAKSGSHWTHNELKAYNIIVDYQDAATFFGQPLPNPPVHPDLLNYLSADDQTDDEAFILLRLMELAMVPRPTQESATDDFTAHLLKILGYAPRPRVIRTRNDIPFLICGEYRKARTDVCILSRDGINLVVQEDKRHFEIMEPLPQLVAEAIAAFQDNNATCARVLRQPPITSKVMAGIEMTGTFPKFYKIPVTEELVTGVETAQYPANTTIVHGHIPEIPRPTKGEEEGMVPLDNRRVILACFEAFKQFVN